MKEYGWTPDFVRKGITGVQGWVYYFWAVESESLEKSTTGYVKREWLKLMAKLS